MTTDPAVTAEYLIPVEVVWPGPYSDATNGSYFKGRIRNSPVGDGYILSISHSQVVTREQVEAEVRERIAAEIEAYRAEFSYVGPQQRDYIDAERAARIARGQA